ncbi:hypothetical protein L6R52_19685, partial [Myxococcota bacterium]|nr:hypothetical protein [Myxococcota bacterium]
MPLGLLLSAVVALAPASTPPLSATLGDVPFSVTADRLSATPKKGIYVAEGNVVVTRPGVGLRADRVVFDEPARKAIAEGNVAVVEGSTVLMCRRVELELPGLVGGVEQAELHVKAGVIDLSTWTGTTAVESLGRDLVRLDADAVERTGPRSLEIRGGAFTACDCGPGATPTWSIDASAASIDLESGALLSWPVFYAKGVPIFALPIFYLPLGERRTGLLAPRVGLSRTTGLRFSEPLFLTLGDSWDATIEAGMMLSRGFTSELELRWAPAADARGSLRGALLLDRGVPDGAGGFSRDRADVLPRFTIAGRHDSKVLERARLAADVNLVGDPAYLSELAAVYLERQVETTTSRVTLSTWTGSNVRVSGGVSWLQDLRAQRYPLARVVSGAPAELRDTSLFSSDVFTLDQGLHGAGAVRQRLAELRLDALPYVLTEGSAAALVGEARLALSAHGALSSALARFVRADLRPELSAPISLAGLAVLE